MSNYRLVGVEIATGSGAINPHLLSEIALTAFQTQPFCIDDDASFS